MNSVIFLGKITKLVKKCGFLVDLVIFLRKMTKLVKKMLIPCKISILSKNKYEKKQTGWFNLNIAEYAFLFWWLRLLSQSFYKNKLSKVLATPSSSLL